ncbi:RIP metalloprotease [bacterium]|jgi:regulator of sigma E protease|nr:RIP metalloprotease [bacterium]
MKILYFILGLSFLIFFHEFGHFLFAKLFKVYVYEFSIFMGPKIAQKKIGETKYSLRLLPIGGYVSMAGENDTQASRNEKEELEEDISEVTELNEEEVRPRKKEEELPEVPFERTLLGIKNWKKLLIMFAGPLFNIILCFVLMLVFYVSTPIAKVNVVENSVAYNSGLRSDDEIRDIYVLFYDGECIKENFLTGAYREDVDNYRHLSSVNQAAYNYLYDWMKTKDPNLDTYPNPVNLEIRLVTEDNDRVSIVQPYTIKLNEDKKAIDSSSYIDLESLGLSCHGATMDAGKAFVKAGKTEVAMASAIYKALGNLFSREGFSSVAGPVGMYSIATTYMDIGFMYYLFFIAMISVNLGIMNLLPFPALDGGKIIITLVEMVIRRRVNPKFEGVLNAIGFLLLMGFMLVVTFKDIFFPIR